MNNNSNGKIEKRTTAAPKEELEKKGITCISDALLEVCSHIDGTAKSTSKVAGISTGLKTLDFQIGGFRPGTYTVLAAKTGMGKTTLAMNIASSVSKDPDKAVLYVSTEMNNTDLCLRLISSEGLLDLKKLSNGALETDEEWEALAEAASSLANRKLYFCDQSVTTVAEIENACECIGNLSLVVIDYLQQLEAVDKTSGRGGNRQQTVSDISRAIHRLAGRLQVPFLCLSQFSRASDGRQDKRPKLSDLRDSGSIEQDADAVLFLYRENYDDSKTPLKGVEEVECIVSKNRHGGVSTAVLQWTPKYVKFEDVPEPELPFTDEPDEADKEPEAVPQTALPEFQTDDIGQLSA